MKNAALVILFLFCSILGFSQESKWVFFTENQEPFYLYINNQLQNRVPLQQVEADHLVLKEYQVTIEFKDITLGVIRQNIKTKKERETVYVVYNNGGVDYEVDLYVKAKRGVYSPGVKVPQIADYEGYKGKVGCAQPVSEAKVNELVETLEGYTFGDQGAESIRAFIKNHCVTVAQFKKMLKTVDFEDNKLSLAKYAFSYVFDRENYYLIHNLFDYPYSVEDLNNYIGNRP